MNSNYNYWVPTNTTTGKRAAGFPVIKGGRKRPKGSRNVLYVRVRQSRKPR